MTNQPPTPTPEPTRNRNLSAVLVDEEELDATQAQAMEVPPDEAPRPKRLPAAGGDDVPDWVEMPADLRVPKGRQLVFIRIWASLTATPHKGDRQCIIWSLSDGDEKLAADRCQGEVTRASSEYTKQMLRAVDGVVADWSKAKGPGSVDTFWREIGPKGRNLLQRVYTQLHMASDDELADFFDKCVAVRSTG